MKTMLGFLKPYKVSITIAYIFTFIELMAELLFPFFLGIMINEGIIDGRTDRILMWGGIMLGVTFIALIAGICNSFYASHTSTMTGYTIREKLFSTIQQFSFDTLNLYPTSMIVTRFTNDVRQIQNTLFMSLRVMVKAPLMIVGSVIMAFIVDFQISLIFLFTVPLLIAFLYWVLLKGSNMFTRVQERVDHVNQVIQENIAGMRIIKAFVRRDFEKSRFSKSNKALATQTQTAFRFVEASMPILLFVMNISLIFIIWYGNKQAALGTTSVGDIVAIVNYALRTVMAISMLTFISLAFSRAKASAERVHQILTEKVPKKNGLTTNQLEMDGGKISFHNVSFTYHNSPLPVLERLHFTVQPKETLAVIGATGAGKTTLFQLIPRLYEPDQGEIRIDDIPVQHYEIEALREHIGYVSQNPLLFTGTIADNIRFGKEDATEEEIIAAAKKAQIHDSIVTFPNQYDTIIGQKGVNLSGGQKQRISIARAFVRKPTILMLDDSTSALDLATERRLLQAIQNYHCTTLIITQKITTAQQADRILLLDEGVILAIGSHESLLASSVLYENIVATQKELLHVN